jgi:uncharacterized membrane protein YjjB (DUF3815 family)
MNPVDVIGLLLQDAFWSGLAAAGFAILFNVPQRVLIGCALCGAAGHAARTLLIHVGFEFELATLFGATIIGFMGVMAARRWQVPVLIYGISAGVTLVPGAFAYRTMLGILELSTADPTVGEAALLSTVINGIKTGLTLGAIATGIAAPRLLFLRHRPVV